MSLVTGYQPWGWILGSGVLLQDIEATMWSQYEWMGGATLLVILLMGLLGLSISRSIFFCNWEPTSSGEPCSNSIFFM